MARRTKHVALNTSHPARRTRHVAPWHVARRTWYCIILVSAPPRPAPLQQAGQAFDVRVYARKPLRSPLDAVLVVRRANGAGIVSNDDSGGPDAYLRFTTPADEDVIIEVSDHLKKGGENYVYRVEVTPVVPELTMTLPERRQYISTTLNIPRGNRSAQYEHTMVITRDEPIVLTVH